MRYMWICHRELSPSVVRERLAKLMPLEPVVLRVFNTQKRSCWAFITNQQTYKRAKEDHLTDTSVGPWSITSCNKQYVTDERQKRIYLGCLAEVKSSEAHAWIDGSEATWYLRKFGEDIYWIPVMRNPNKIIPTGDDPTRLFPRQDRNWPLPAASYEQWRDKIVNKMIKTLDESL